MLGSQQRREPDGAFSSSALTEKQGNEPGDAYDAFVAALAERPDAIVIDDPLVGRRRTTRYCGCSTDATAPLRRGSAPAPARPTALTPPK